MNKDTKYANNDILTLFITMSTIIELDLVPWYNADLIFSLELYYVEANVCLCTVEHQPGALFRVVCKKCSTTLRHTLRFSE